MMCVTCWHAAAAQAIRAFSTAYCRATAESVAITSFFGSAEAPLSLVSKERRNLVQHSLRDRRTGASRVQKRPGSHFPQVETLQNPGVDSIDIVPGGRNARLDSISAPRRNGELTLIQT